MKLISTLKEIKNGKSRQLFKLECECCKNQFKAPKNQILTILKGKSHKKLMYCSKNCQSVSQITKTECECKNCGKKFLKAMSEIKRSKNHFCSSSCSAIYNQAHKMHGCRRSKLEIWLESELVKFYPDLEIHFNRKDTINSELDIHIPSLKLAFELNGIFHYEPIYGKEKLDKIQNNDNRKFQACLENNIELCIIDSSKLLYFKKEKAKKYLDIIINIIALKFENNNDGKPKENRTLI